MKARFSGKREGAPFCESSFPAAGRSASVGKVSPLAAFPASGTAKKTKNEEKNRTGACATVRFFLREDVRGKGINRLSARGIAATALGILLVFGILRVGLGFFLLILLVLLVLVLRIGHVCSPPSTRCVRQSRLAIA